MTFVDVILASLLPWAAGAGCLAALGILPRLDRLAWASWAWFAGLLATACVLWVALAAELPLEAGWMRATLAALALGGGVLGLARSRRAPAGRSEPLTRGTRIGMAVCVLLAVASVTDSVLFKMTTPVAVKDEATNWTSKAKQLFLARGFNPALDAEIRRSLDLAVRAPHPNYPNLVPLVHLWSYVNGGRVLHFENRLPILLCRYALVLALAGALLSRLRSPWIGLLLLPATYNLCRRDEGADVVVALGLLVSVDAVARFFESGATSWIRLGAIGAAFLGAAKHEGQILLVALGCAAAVQLVRTPARRGAFLRALPWLVVPALAVGSTWWFNWRFDVWNAVVSERADGSTFASRIAGSLGERGPRLVSATWDVLSGTGLDARVLHAIFLLLLAVCARAAFAPRAALATLTILLAWGGALPAFLGTPYPFDWFVNVALARVMDQWAPLVCLWIAALPSGITATGAWSAIRRGAIPVCVAVAAATPLVRLWTARIHEQASWASGILAQTEDERLARYLGPTWECFRALRDRSDPATPVVLVLPIAHETSDVWAQFAALLYPKRVLALVPGAEHLTAVLREHNIRYDNSLAGVAKLAGGAFDVAVFGAAPPLPEVVRVDVRERGPGFVIGRVAAGPLAPESR